MSLSLSITTRYLTGDRWNSNSGGVRATALGRQRTVRWNPALSSEANYAAAATALAEALHDIGAAPGRKVVETAMNDSGTVRTFTVTT